MNRVLKGLPAAPGVAAGRAYVCARRALRAERRSVENANGELEKLASAVGQAEGQLAGLRERAQEQVGADDAAILQAQVEMLHDPELQKRVKSTILNQRVNVEYAWQEGIQFYVDVLRKIKDETLAARAADLGDAGRRVLTILLNCSEPPAMLEEPSIIVAQELAPSDTIQFGRRYVLGFCTKAGGPTSHVAILSKALGVPCIVGLGDDLDEIETGCMLIADGDRGELVVEPDAERSRKYELSRAGDRASHEIAIRDAKQPAISKDGRHVEVVANVGSEGDAAQALENGAEGIGLLRTEFLFLDRPTAPDEAEQVRAYSGVFEAIGRGKPIVVRTLDIGGDKPAKYLQQPDEKNPFLGLRGIRLSLRFTDLFETQLRALLIAGQDYDLRIMFPMVASPEELQEARCILNRADRDLAGAGIPHCEHYQVGIMVEVPSAALRVADFADAADFFSIGTNDLSQYTLAAERTSAEVAHLADPFHPAVLELIQRVIEAAHAHGKWVGLCGEMAGDPLATPILLGLGLDEFSASPRLIPALKQTIRGLDAKQARTVAVRAIGLKSASEVREYLRKLCVPAEEDVWRAEENAPGRMRGR